MPLLETAVEIDSIGCMMLQFVRATRNCKDEVLSLRTELSSQRYIIDKYDSYIEDPDRICMVAKDCDEVVAFEVLRFYDDGITVLKQSAMVKENREGKGYLKQLDKYCDAILKEKGYSLVLHCISNIKQVYNSPKIGKIFIIKARKTVFSYKKSTEFDNFLGQTYSLYSVNSNLMKTYIKTTRWRKYLFPEEMDMVAGLPFRLHETAVSMFEKEAITFYSNLKGTDGCISGLLSSAKYDGLLNLDIFGHDVESVQQHIGFHLMRNSKTLKCGSLISVITQQDDRKVIDGILKGFGFSEVPKMESAFLILEKQLKSAL